jgi:hypothetical protein
MIAFTKSRLSLVDHSGAVAEVLLDLAPEPRVH